MVREKSILEMLDSMNTTTNRRKKRVKLTPARRIFIWENPKLFGRVCSICHEKITKASDLELDHTKPFKSGRRKLSLAHKLCNRMKHSGSLDKIQRELGLKRTTKRHKKTKRRKKKLNKNPWQVKFPNIKPY